MDGDLLTKMFFGAISGILFFWLGPKIMGSKQPKRRSLRTPGSTSNIPANHVIESAQRQINHEQNILELKNQGLLTEAEYNEKLKKIEQEGERPTSDSCNIDVRLRDHTNSLLLKLNELRNAGIINNEEFTAKKEKLLNDKKTMLFSNPFEIIEFNRLTRLQKKTVKELYLKFKEERVYLLTKSDKNVHSYSDNEIESILVKGYCNKYYFINSHEGFI